MVPLMVLLGWLLDVLSLKRLSDAIFVRYAGPSDRDYPVHRALWGLLAAGRVDDARRLARACWDARKSPRMGRDLIHVLLRQKAFREASQVASEMAARHPDQPWILILAADIRKFFLDDEEASLAMYRDALPACESAMPDIYPQAVLLKRLTSIYRRRGDDERLADAMEKFYALAPTNFHDDEFILLAEFRLKRGDRDGAKSVLETACQAMARNVPVRKAYERMGFGEAPPIRGRKAGVAVAATAVSRVTVKTALLTEADDPVETVRAYAGGRVQAGDIVTLSSCVGAIMEGRMLMEGTVRPSFLARFLSRLIAGAHQTGPFGASAPMANPLSAQTALEEVGTLRLVAAALIGAVGKVFDVSGWFYVVAGAQVAQIDDILGSVPPYDYYVMMGPRDPSALSNRMAAALGEGVKAAIIDANDLGIAWAVGFSDGVDAKALESAMSDNPAGNQDQMTPLVIVRPAQAAEASRSAESSQPTETTAFTESPQSVDSPQSPGPFLAATLSRAAQLWSSRTVRRAVIAVVAVTVLGASTLALANRRPRGVQVPVLLYHEIGLPSRPGSGLSVPAQEFEDQMALLQADGHSTITTGALSAYLSGNGSLPLRPVLITFDDGYESVYAAAYPVLRDKGFKATVFVVGATLNTPNHLTFDQLREMVASGLVEVGWHTYAGHSGTSGDPDMGWTNDQLRVDFRKLAEVSGAARIPVVPAFAYPFGRAGKSETMVAREWGFTVGFTTQDGLVNRKDSPMLLKRITVWPGNSDAAFLAKIAPTR